jgi:polyisoprenyl-phosphate glycosyltransferase
VDNRTVPGRREDDAAVGVSIVAPCYNEEDCVEEFIRRACAAAHAVVGEDYEVVLVDDGSTDRTWPLIDRLARDNERLVGIKLLRNHGHQLAATAGLATCRGARVMLIDADLQDPPELLGDMMAVMDGGADVVYGQRRSREGDSLFKRATANLFYRLLSRLSRVPIPQDTGDFRLMRRRIVDILMSMPEHHRFIRGMIGWIGGRQIAFPYDRKPRFAGTTKYPLVKMIRFATDAITSFSVIPLRAAVWLGGLTALGALGLLAYSILRWLAGDTLAGWTSLITAVTAFSAIQIMILGIIGEYLGRLVMDSKGRPLFIIDQVVGGGRRRETAANMPAPAKGP